MIFFKLLPIFFGCHQMPERSFFYRDRQFPICARCTGILAGYIAGIGLSLAFNIFKWYIVICLALPMIFDGVIQKCTKYESTNLKRVVTGFMFGIATIQIIIHIHLNTVKLAAQLVNIISKS